MAEGQDLRSHEATLNDEVACFRALVRGRVQGVFYREFVRVHALRLGVVGWARNLPDGMTVEVLAEGALPTLHELLTQLRQGPPSARVATADVEWESARSELTSFQIR